MNFDFNLLISFIIASPNINQNKAVIGKYEQIYTDKFKQKKSNTRIYLLKYFLSKYNIGDIATIIIKSLKNHK